MIEYFLKFLELYSHIVTSKSGLFVAFLKKQLTFYTSNGPSLWIRPNAKIQLGLKSCHVQCKFSFLNEQKHPLNGCLSSLLHCFDVYAYFILPASWFIVFVRCLDFVCGMKVNHNNCFLTSLICSCDISLRSVPNLMFFLDFFFGFFQGA